MSLPGGTELVIIGLIVILLFGLPVALVVLLLARRGSSDHNVEDYERRVEELGEELEEERSE